MRWKMREKEGRMHRDEILYEKGENGNEKEWKKKTKKGEKERKREKSWMKNERIEQNNGFRRLKKGKKKKGRKKEYREREKERKRREWMNESPIFRHSSCQYPRPAKSDKIVSWIFCSLNHANVLIIESFHV